MKNYRFKTIRGFTLTELMVTLTILGITLTIGLPSFQLSSSNSRLTSSVNTMTGALQLARSEAIKRVKNAGIVPIDGTRTEVASWQAATGLVVFADKNANGAWDPSPNVASDESVQYYELAKKVAISNTNNFNATYRPDGRINGIGGSFIFADAMDNAPNNCRLLSISNTGRTTCCRWVDSDNTWHRCDDMTKQCSFDTPPSCPPSP